VVGYCPCGCLMHDNFEASWTMGSLALRPQDERESLTDRPRLRVIGHLAAIRTWLLELAPCIRFANSPPGPEVRPDKRLLASVIGRVWQGWGRVKKDPVRLEVSSEARTVLRAIRPVGHPSKRDEIHLTY